MTKSKTELTRRGKSFHNRDVSSRPDSTANQWSATQQQQKWLVYYMDPNEKETWGNAYQSAIKAGYSESYASKIMSESLALEWVRQAKNIMRLNPEHLKSALNKIIGNEFSKDSDKIAAIKLLGIDQGMFVQKQLVGHVNLEELLNNLE